MNFTARSMVNLCHGSPSQPLRRDRQLNPSMASCVGGIKPLAKGRRRNLDGAKQYLICIITRHSARIIAQGVDHSSSALFPSPELVCCWNIGACSVGIRTRVCGNSISVSCSFCTSSFSGASLGFGILTASDQRRPLSQFSVLETYRKPY